MQDIHQPGNLLQQSHSNKVLKPKLAGRLASTQVFSSRHRPMKQLY